MKMRHKILSLSLALLVLAACHAAGQVPKLMIIPDDIYLSKKGYMLTFDNEGTEVKVPDYDKALTNDSDLYTSIVKVQELFAERGFKLADLKATLDGIKNDAAYTNMLSNKASGSGIVQSPLDLLNNKAKPDMIISLAFFVEKSGPRRQVNFNIRALDAYSLKAVASVNGIGAPSALSVVAELVAEAVVNELPKFQQQIQDHFNNIKGKGREMTFRFLLFEDAMVGGFDEDCGQTGEEYIDVLDAWFSEHAVDDVWELVDDSDTRLVYTARLPMFDELGKKVRIRAFTKAIEKLLEGQCGLEDQVKKDGKGQGEAWFLIGPAKM